MEDATNVYKYKQHYIKCINDTSIESIIEDQLIMFLLFIQRERGTCRYHNNKNEWTTEKVIIFESHKILKKTKIYKIYDINTILHYESKIIYENNEEYGCKYDINFASILDINDNNIYPILQNLMSIKCLRKLNNHKNIDNLNKIIDYLECFRCFNMSF